MKNLLAGIALLVGIGIGYFWGVSQGKTQTINDLLLKKEDVNQKKFNLISTDEYIDIRNKVLLSFNPVDMRFTKSTKPITRADAQTFTTDFKTKLEGSGDSGGKKLLFWEPGLIGWKVDADLLKKLIEQEKKGNDNYCKDVMISLGINSKGETKLIFSGLEKGSKTNIRQEDIDGSDYIMFNKTDIYDRDEKVMDSQGKEVTIKKMNRWNNKRKAQNTGSDDFLLEYVDPCNPKCPENSF